MVGVVKNVLRGCDKGSSVPKRWSWKWGKEERGKAAVTESSEDNAASLLLHLKCQSCHCCAATTQPGLLPRKPAAAAASLTPCILHSPWLLLSRIWTRESQGSAQVTSPPYVTSCFSMSWARALLFQGCRIKSRRLNIWNWGVFIRVTYIEKLFASHRELNLYWAPRSFIYYIWQLNCLPNGCIQGK